MSDAVQETEAPSFRAAMDELEGILERIEGEEVDIDRLAEELRRAAAGALPRQDPQGRGRGHPDRPEPGARRGRVVA
jgi:hypothetical protein